MALTCSFRSTVQHKSFSRPLINACSDAYTGQQRNYVHAAKQHYPFCYQQVNSCTSLYVVSSCDGQAPPSSFLFVMKVPVSRSQCTNFIVHYGISSHQKHILITQLSLTWPDHFIPYTNTKGKKVARLRPHMCWITDHCYALVTSSDFTIP